MLQFEEQWKEGEQMQKEPTTACMLQKQWTGDESLAPCTLLPNRGALFEQPCCCLLHGTGLLVHSAAENNDG